MPATLYRRHDAAARTRYQDLKQLAFSQQRVLAGTPGTLKQRTQSGKQYWVREHIRVDGKKSDEYIGPASSVEDTTVERCRAGIELAKALASGSANLRLFGYQRIDRKPAAVMQVFFNRGLVAGGLVLVGSQAYGALLNELGINAPGYKTHDIDVARAQPLSVALPQGSSFQGLLNETGLTFASFKLPGDELLAVDLLVPGSKAGQLVAVDELGTHAQAIPFLDFLVAEAIDSVVLSPNQVIPARVPCPERFVIHKLFSSQSRRSDRDKTGKDLQQAAILAGAVEDETPGRLAAAFRSMPAAGKSRVKRAAAAAAKLLGSAHPEAHHALVRIAAK